MNLQDSILSILRMVLVPTPSVCLEDLSTSVLTGVIYGNAMVGRPSGKDPIKLFLILEG